MTALAQILEDMLAEAKAKNVSKRRLKNGLRIEIKVIRNDVKVTLERPQVFPSATEWDTVMKNFPYSTPRVLPAPLLDGSRFLLTGTVPSQRMMQLKFS